MAVFFARHLFSAWFALVVSASGAPARAQPEQLGTWSTEALEGVAQSLESPELRLLRQVEDELFGGGPAGQPETYDPDCIYGVPDALSSDAHPPRIERPQGPIDLSFLAELKLPSLPVRWDSRVIDYLLFFKNDKRGRELMGAWLKRMERYGPMIRRVLAEHSLPHDLEYVAMVESGYDPEARSFAQAQGLWQFMKQPGNYYGLRIDHWTDERLDPEASTRAAARFLRDLYDRFGSWELALASYNMGYSGLLRAVRKYNTNDYWLLSHLEAGLPYETSLYVAKITAVALIGNNPEKFGFDDLTLEPTLAVAKVDVPAGTALAPIANAAGVEHALLEKLNPHLKRGRVSPGEGQLNVYIPREQYGRFAERWSRNKEPAQHVSYVVRFGETFEDVARRFSISPAQLCDINHLPSDALVGAGFPLIVPAVAEVTTVDGLNAVATVPPRTFQYEGRRRVFYRVAGHDTPEAVARFFEVTVEELQSWNHLAPGATLQRDMLMQLFVRKDLDLSTALVLAPEQVRILTVGTDEFFDFHEAQRGRVRARYRVQPSDTLSKIGQKFDLSAGSIARINQFATHSALTVDSWIIVYVPEKQVPELEKKGLLIRVSTTAPAGLTPNQAEKTRELLAVEAATRTPRPEDIELETDSEPTQALADEKEDDGAPGVEDERALLAPDEPRPTATP